MPQDTPPDHISKKRVVYDMAGTEAIVIRRDVEFPASDGGVLTMDIYDPPAAARTTGAPVMIIVAGYPDEGFQRIVGCRFKDMGSSTCWGRLIAASGMAAITYTNRRPEQDLRALVDHIARNAASLGLDGTVMGLWASSGNVPLALSLLIRDLPQRFACATLLYGLMLDLDGMTGVAARGKDVWIRESARRSCNRRSSSGRAVVHRESGPR